MPGKGKQSDEVQAQIKQLLDAGFDPTTISRRLKVGRSSIYRMKRCIEQHGTNYMPPELNKRNGRPKVLTSEQELMETCCSIYALSMLIEGQEVLAWLRTPSNRTRYLDDLVWLVHDKFGIVCSTTTMSKMKRKWMQVIEYEEIGQPIDESARKQLEETHPDLPLLQNLPPVDQMPPPLDVDVEQAHLTAHDIIAALPNAGGQIQPADMLGLTLPNHHQLPQQQQQLELPNHPSQQQDLAQTMLDVTSIPGVDLGAGSLHDDLSISSHFPQLTAADMLGAGVLHAPLVHGSDLDVHLEQQLHDDITAAAANVSSHDLGPS